MVLYREAGRIDTGRTRRDVVVPKLQRRGDFVCVGFIYRKSMRLLSLVREGDARVERAGIEIDGAGGLSNLMSFLCRIRS